MPDPASRAPQESREPRISRRVLVVEDHNDSAQALARLLALDGHKTRIAATLADAQRLCTDEKFDVILCDLGLPDGNGLDLASTARVACPAARLIAVTGHGMTQDLKAIEAAGFDGHVLKPFTIESLLRQLK